MSWENRKHISERTANRSMSSRKMCSSWGDSRAAGVGARREPAWPRLTRGFIVRLNRFRVYGRHVHTSTHLDRKSTRLNSSHSQISYAVFCLKKKKHK